MTHKPLSKLNKSFAIFIQLSPRRHTYHTQASALRHELSERVQERQHRSNVTMSTPLDLGALRREREARQAVNKKRERSVSPPSPRKAPKVDATTVELPSGARLTSFTSIVNKDQQDRKSVTANAHNNALSTTVKQETPTTTSSVNIIPGEITYPYGVVKKTWALHHARDGSDIKIEEVLEPQTLQTAVLSAYQWKADWVLSKLRTPQRGGTTKCVFVMQAKEPSLRASMRQEVEGMRSWLRMCFPPMEGQTFCMHSKLMLLFHPKKLRIAIPSANLLPFDWGETGVMENSVFLIDLPRLPPAIKKAHDGLTEFGKELIYFMKKKGLDQDILDGVLNFDFAKTENIAFVHSVGGISINTDADRTGVASLSKAVRQLGLASNDAQIDFAASSIGNLKDSQLALLQHAACGKNVFEMAAAQTTKVDGKGKKMSHAGQSNSLRDKFRIYFPTQETVKCSTAGAAGTICLSREWFENDDFPRECFRDYISIRPGLLSHNKIMYIRSTGADKLKAYVYVGSANISESAWGKLVYKKKEKTWHINCRNWECGVLMAVPEKSLNKSVKIKQEESEDSLNKSVKIKLEEGEEAGADTSTDMDIFNSIVKPPFMYPGVDYDGQEPWYFKEELME